ncbi:hypothetical protein EON67_03940 [archaeon]|nr:MAG: hypothetical protein EON67_03940 [archaeon]
MRPEQVQDFADDARECLPERADYMECLHRDKLVRATSAACARSHARLRLRLRVCALMAYSCGACTVWQWRRAPSCAHRRDLLVHARFGHLRAPRPRPGLQKRRIIAKALEVKRQASAETEVAGHAHH